MESEVPKTASTSSRRPTPGSLKDEAVSAALEAALSAIGKEASDAKNGTTHQTSVPKVITAYSVSDALKAVWLKLATETLNAAVKDIQDPSSSSASPDPACVIKRSPYVETIEEYLNKVIENLNFAENLIWLFCFAKEAIAEGMVPKEDSSLKKSIFIAALHSVEENGDASDLERAFRRMYKTASFADNSNLSIDFDYVKKPSAMKSEVERAFAAVTAPHGKELSFDEGPTPISDADIEAETEKRLFALFLSVRKTIARGEELTITADEELTEEVREDVRSMIRVHSNTKGLQRALGALLLFIVYLAAEAEKASRVSKEAGTETSSAEMSDKCEPTSKKARKN